MPADSRPPVEFGERRYDAALLAELVGGATVKDAAAAAGCDEKTARVRRRDAAFAAREKAERDALLEDSRSAKAALYVRSLEVLRAQLDHADTPATVKAKIGLAMVAAFGDEVGSSASEHERLIGELRDEIETLKVAGRRAA
jgi:hypothetical protein